MNPSEGDLVDGFGPDGCITSHHPVRERVDGQPDVAIRIEHNDMRSVYAILTEYIPFVQDVSRVYVQGKEGPGLSLLRGKS